MIECSFTNQEVVGPNPVAVTNGFFDSSTLGFNQKPRVDYFTQKKTKTLFPKFEG